MMFLDALGPRGPYRARNRLPIPNLAGDPLAELSLVPKLYVARAMSALRAAVPLPLEQRLAALANAGELFATGEVDGMPVAVRRANWMPEMPAMSPSSAGGPWRCRCSSMWM
jgi:hypothetical protein